MSLLPSTSQVAIYCSGVLEQFNYFARPLIIYKEPIQNITNQPQNILFGYSPDSQSTNSQITYSSVNQIFSGLIIHQFKSKGSTKGTFDNKMFLADGQSYIKVRQDGFDYINNGQKTEKIECDGATYNLGSKWQQQHFLTLKFYYFEINETN